MICLGEMYPIEQARVRELLQDYKDIGPAGQFGAMMIEQVLQRADRAAMSGDLAEMIKAFEDMKGCK